MNSCRLLCLAISIAATLPAARGSSPARELRDDAGTFPKGDPAQLGIGLAALEKLKAKAESEDSDAVVVIKDGLLIADWDFGKKRGPIHAMSATKSVVNLAVGRLIDEGKIKSLDQPVSDFFLEWRQGRKRKITIRHLLNHTSGLEDQPTTSEIYPSPDYVQFALAADLVADPGTKFFYSNKATNLLAGVVLKASGRPLDEYVKREIFAPLEIVDFTWSKDDAGNPHGMAGLSINAVDLAKLGQFMLDEGVWHGHRIVSRAWVSESTRQGQPYDATCGLLWWRTPQTTKFAIDDNFINELKTQFGLTDSSVKKLEALKGKPFESGALWPGLSPIFQTDANTGKNLQALDAKLKKKVPVAAVVGEGPMHSFAARGYLGQYLVVVPQHRIVAVRQRRKPENFDSNDYRNSFGDFEAMVYALVNTAGQTRSSAVQQPGDPLPSWNEGSAKKTIIAFVTRVTAEGGPDFVPKSARVATFDNDGTLWCEQPIYVQAAFAFHRARVMAAQNPSLKNEPGFQAIIANDREAMSRFAHDEIISLLAVTHAGITPEAFDEIAKAWLGTAEHPKYHRLYKECLYQPQLELLAYLRENDFKLFIVTGGGIEFVRAFAEEAYGVPRERVIGSSTKTRFETKDGKPELIKLPQIGSIDDREGKPININLHIGIRPILAFGNSDGDLQMLEYTAAGRGPRLSLLVHHDDATREYAYDRESTVGRLDKALDAAQRQGWTVVSMKNDWRTIFPKPVQSSRP